MRMRNDRFARGSSLTDAAYDAAMASVFTMIIDGDLPGHFVHRDDVCVVFLSINPIADGHALVVPRAEVDQWTDLDEATCTHLMAVAKRVADAQKVIFSPARIGLMIAGFEVPHTHVHVIPIDTMADMDFANAAASVDHDQLAAYATSLADALAT